MSDNEQIDIPDGSLLVALDGCGYCEAVKSELSDRIKKGEVDVLQCNIYNKNNGKNYEKCMDIINRPDFDGFPTIYDTEGNKVI